MNALSLRHHVTSYLNGIGQPSEIVRVEKLSPVPGEPVVAVVTVTDPFTEGNPLRRFRITFEEID